ncbi:MAG: tRNA preQ1(34) S-adenosylmethionine ribosyltransferase-isomerase QueA [Xanthomonadales bacterium]|nr:S-adenosylmethionine:tRNA ribosyltransferase-isomerase [Xanthomonadales bacterium]MCC6593126.1 tRNA preQ1(34) S-adenosylmethionine ribosyltransferase-isomerase QueA [Xanthomonadales bacterium]MCE7930266.1 tRNA preQ1(34) S-adenosylmethionine ribosyltransferase-isomerase QueA [Xanthomonadales bacterium PRO6]
MRKQDFDYPLPPELIAQQPPTERSAGRLLVLDPLARTWADSAVRALPDWLRAGDLLVFNDTRVWPARLRGRKSSGGAVELLLERLLAPDRGWFHLGVGRKPKTGARIEVADDCRFEVLERDGALFLLRSIDGAGIPGLLARHGHVPLPPYIERVDDALDRARYQTVYARDPGSAAAPTAGLHFDEALLDAVRARGIGIDFVTLHVGAGTFQNLREDELDQVVLHREWCSVPAALVDRIAAVKAASGRVIAVGTTSARSLESAAVEGSLAPCEGDTRLFIRPGFKFRVIDGLLTNFHLPQSSLLMLVCALAGREFVLDAYRHAVEQRYRFFSYGDACLVLPVRERDSGPASSVRRAGNPSTVRRHPSQA